MESILGSFCSTFVVVVVLFDDRHKDFLVSVIDISFTLSIKHLNSKQLRSFTFSWWI